MNTTPYVFMQKSINNFWLKKKKKKKKKKQLFLMTDYICHSSLPCVVLEKVALTSTEVFLFIRAKT